MLFFYNKSYIYNGDLMINKMGDYLTNKKYKMIIDEESIYIVNYKILLSLEDNYISLLTDKKKIEVSGRKLQLKKIVENELLIKGFINKIEVKDEK